MKIIDRIRDIQNSSYNPHIMIPRGVLAALMAVLFIIPVLITVCWQGIFVIVSVFLIFILAIFIYMIFSIWERYYSKLSYVIIVTVEILLAVIIARAFLEML